MTALPALGFLSHAGVMCSGVSIKIASAVYHWVRQVLTGGREVARRPSGDELTLETAELSALEGKANRLSAEELGLLAERLASAVDPAEAALLRERLTRGFYGI